MSFAGALPNPQHNECARRTNGDANPIIPNLQVLIKNNGEIHFAWNSYVELEGDYESMPSRTASPVIFEPAAGFSKRAMGSMFCV